MWLNLDLTVAPEFITPLYPACSYWLLLVESSGDWLISKTSGTFGCLLVLGFSRLTDFKTFWHLWLSVRITFVNFRS